MKRLLSVIALALAASFAINAQEKESVETDVNQYGQVVKTVPVQGNLQDGILVFQNKKQNYKMWFDVRIQADAAAFFGAPDFCAKQLDGKDNTNHIGNGMNIRRARFAVKAQLDKNWYGEIDTDWTSGIPEIKDAIVAFTGVNGLEIKAGNFKENFSIQRNTTSRYLMFMERPMVCSLAPSRHLGINARYAYNWLWVAGGVFGPELKGSEEQTAMEDGNKDFGFNEGLSYTGKVVFRPLWKSPNSSLHIGGAFSYRNPKLTSTDGYNCIRYSTRNTTSINRKKYIDTDVIKGLDHELAWTVELQDIGSSSVTRLPTLPEAPSSTGQRTILLRSGLKDGMPRPAGFSLAAPRTMIPTVQSTPAPPQITNGATSSSHSDMSTATSIPASSSPRTLISTVEVARPGLSA